MASSLELAKLILAGYLYNYWEKINKGFRIYLSIATLVLVLITSLGIYGFLTSAFQNTFKTYSVTSTEKAFLQQKEKFWEDDLVRYDTELDRISENIATLSSAKSQQIQYKDSDGNVRNTVSTAELRAAQSRIATEEVNRKEVQSKRQIAADSLQSIKIKILEIDTNTEVGSELGPLQYLSGLLGKPMDVIINWFILIIIFVFDPLAVSLVIAFNNAMKVDRGEYDKEKVIKKRELYGDEPDEDNEGSDIYTEDELKDWDTTLSDGLEDEEWDEDHALDQTLNDMVDDLPEEVIDEILEGEELRTDFPNFPNLDWHDVSYEDSKVETDASTTDDELSNLKRDTNRRGIDIDGDGTIDGYDNNGDGLIDEPVPSSSRRAQYVMKEKPYYARPNFNWGDRKAWINNQNAVNYWLTYIKNEKDTSYPTDFDSKTY